MAAAVASGRAAQPLIISVETRDGIDGEMTDEEAAARTVVIQAEIPEVKPFAGTGAGGGAFDDEGPAWPDEASESAMRAEIGARGETLNAKAAREAAEAAAEAAAEKRNLPPLDELIARIPADVRGTLEDLLRANFTKVVRAPKKALKE